MSFSRHLTLSRPTRLAGTCLTAAAVLALAACTSDDGDTPEAAADRLAGALSSGTLPAELFTSPEGQDPQEQYDEVVAGLEDVLADDTRPQVEVEEVAVGEDETSATASLTWTWTIRDESWSYTVSADLTKPEEPGEGEPDTWRLAWDPALVESSLEPGEVLSAQSLVADRGRVLDGKGDAIVRDRPVVRFGIDKTKVPASRAVASAKELARVLEISAGSFAKAVRGAGEKAFVEALVLRAGDAKTVDPTWSDVKGAINVTDRVPLAPTRTFAAPILGRVGDATAELVEESEGRLQAGDQTGLSGLQLRYDEQLGGTAGVAVLAVGEDRRALFEVEPTKGEPLRLTLDQDLQEKAERVLESQQDTATALVAIRPSDGAILAAATGPGGNGQNLATYGQAAPGSTFKLVSSLAMLREGILPDTQVNCPPSVVVDGKRFENYDDYPASGLGEIPFRDAVANSCNTAFIGLRDKLARDDLAQAAASLGFGVDHDLGFPAYFGQVPDAASETEAAADLIGQGKILASPMTMATVAASIQSGQTVVPFLIEGTTPDTAPQQPLTKKESAALRDLMRAVVTRGSGSVLADVPGVLGAKTGTAEYGSPGEDGSLPTHAWMVVTTEDLAVAAYVEDGDSGSGSAGPLLEGLLSGD